MLDEQGRTAAKMMDSLGPSALMATAADISATAGSVAKGSVMGEPFGFAKSLDAYRGVASAVQDSLAEQMSSFGPSALTATTADIYAIAGSVAKAGWMPDTAAVTKSWQSRAGVASAVKDTLAEQQRMQDRMMKSLGPSATVAGGADVYATAGLVAKGSVVGEPFGFAKSLDARRGDAYISPAHNQVGEMLRTVDSLTASARAAVAYGTLGSVTGVSGYGPGLNGVRTIADFASSLTDTGGLARINDEIARLEKSFAIPSALTDIARTLAGSAQLAGTIKGLDPFVPMRIAGYPSTSGVVSGQAMPAGGPTGPALVVPTAAESALILDWLRDHPSTHEQALRVSDALNGLWVFVALVEAEAHINPSPVVLQSQAWSALVLFVFQLLLRRAKPRE